MSPAAASERPESSAVVVNQTAVGAVVACAFAYCC